MRLIIGILLYCALSVGALAEPVAYRVDQSASELGFVYYLEDDPIRGKFPAFEAELRLDFESVSRSSIAVTLDASQASAGLIFATEAMRGESILNVAAFPEISFVSKAVRLGPHPTVLISGDLTIRGVTRPIEFSARLLVEDAAQFERKDRLFVALEGEFSRGAFGASGYGDLVADKMKLVAEIAVVQDK